MKRLFFAFLIVLLIFFAFRNARIKAEKNDYIKRISNGSIVSSYEKELFIGKWYSSRAKTEISIRLDGTWSMEKYSGKWVLDEDNFVWIYKGDSEIVDYIYGEVDKNRIVSVGEDEFILEELNGSTTTFRRIKNE